jgi:hypothetical protein
MREMTPYEDPAFSAWRMWREIVPRPESPEAAVAVLRGVADREIARLEELLVDLEEIEGDDALELAEMASFCASDGAERLRRFQTARTRELLRTIDLLAKLRKAESSKPERKAPNEPKPAPVPAPAAPARKAPNEPKPRRVTYRSDGIESLIAQGMTEYLGELLKASEDTSRAPKPAPNEPKPPTPQVDSGQALGPPPPAESGPERTQRPSA